MSSIHERAAASLGWSLRDTTSLSLHSLRELLRDTSPKLVAEITSEIRSGRVVLAEGAPRGAQ